MCLVFLNFLLQDFGVMYSKRTIYFAVYGFYASFFLFYKLFRVFVCVCVCVCLCVCVSVCVCASVFPLIVIKDVPRDEVTVTSISVSNN